MGDKAKNVIMDMMKSEEMRTYFKEIMHEQTEEIVAAINTADERRMEREIEELRNQLSQEKQLYGDSKRKNSDLTLQVNKLQSLLVDKESKIEKLSERCSEFEKKVSVLEITNQQLLSDLAQEKSETETLRIAWSNEKNQMAEELDNFERKFSDIISLHKQYVSLPISVKQRINTIFPNENIYSIIVAVSDWNSIEGLWGFTKRRIIEEETEDLCGLVNLFTAAFHLFSVIEGSGRYEIIFPSIGEHFDPDKHSIKGIKTDGIIEKVLLGGIYDSVAKKTVFKAVVQIQ